MDFTVCSATCFALWPALIVESDSEDRDLLDGVDHPRFRFVMVEQGCKVFQMKYMYICTDLLYSFMSVAGTELLPQFRAGMLGGCWLRISCPALIPISTQLRDPASTWQTRTGHYKLRYKKCIGTTLSILK
jgi:hypothetical protein